MPRAQLSLVPPSAETVVRFWAKVDKNGPVPDPAVYGEIGCCWVWTGGGARGYGQIRDGRRTVKTHRLSWRIAHGSDTTLHVLHRCDRPLCVNPAHLFEGSQADNIQDMVSRGRQSSWRKLTEADVLAIRASSLSQTELARRYGVAAPNINAIVHRRTWRHL